MITYQTYKGSEIESVIEDLASLRIAVFRAFPYLYEGSLEYEKKYLQTYINSPKSFLYAVFDQSEMVGATTCIPLSDETPDVQEPFIKAGMNIDTIFYFGESILLPEYRGLGLGHRFFDEREAHAMSFGTYRTTCFCGVIREENHPLKPEKYKPLDEFWLKRGYNRQPKLQSLFDWLDFGETESTSKPMVYWTKEW